LVLRLDHACHIRNYSARNGYRNGISKRGQTPFDGPDSGD